MRPFPKFDIFEGRVKMLTVLRYLNVIFSVLNEKCANKCNGQGNAVVFKLSI